MQCHRCGERPEAGTRFCPSCGAPVAQRLRTDPGEEAELVLLPKFVPAVALLPGIPVQIFLTVWGAGFFGGFAQLLIQAFDLALATWVPFVFFALVFFFGVSGLVIYVQRRTYARTEFRFTRSELGYLDGFFTLELKSAPLTRVTEVSIRQNFIQKRFGLGTVTLAVAGSSGSEARVVRLFDVPDPEQVFENVKQLVERAQLGEPSRLAA